MIIQETLKELQHPIQVLTFGRNCEGQLGRGNTRSVTQPVLVKSMTSKVVTVRKVSSCLSFSFLGLGCVCC